MPRSVEGLATHKLNISPKALALFKGFMDKKMEEILQSTLHRASVPEKGLMCYQTAGKKKKMSSKKQKQSQLAKFLSVSSKREKGNETLGQVLFSLISCSENKIPKAH